MVGLGDATGDGETEARAAAVAAAGRVQPGEPFEDPFPVGFGDPLPVVVDNELGAVTVRPHLDDHRLPGVPLGVVQQVGDEAVDLAVYDIDGHFRSEQESYLPRVHPPRDLRPYHRRQIDPLVGLGGAALKPGQQEQVGDDRLQPVEVGQRVDEQVTQVGIAGVQLSLLQLGAEPGYGVRSSWEASAVNCR